MSTRIAQYEILSELGAGGMGVVYRALDVDLQREVALKRLRSEFAASAAVLERFRREAQLQGRLNHPNIVQLHSLVQTSDAFCIVMEFIEGVVLKDLVPLPWQQAAPILLQALDGLGYAHSQGVLHRDVKPENILIDCRGIVKVMDFGIAHAVGAERLTREKALIGTIEYMPPERIQGGQVDNRSDIYAMGILLFEVLTGCLPYSTTSEYEVMKWHLEVAPPPLSKFIQVPDGLDQILQKAAAKKPEDRYASCDDMAAALRTVCATAGVDARALPIFAPKSPAGVRPSVSTPEQRQGSKPGALTRVANTSSGENGLAPTRFAEGNPDQEIARLNAANRGRLRWITAGAAVILGAVALIWFFAFRHSRTTAYNANYSPGNVAIAPTADRSPSAAAPQSPGTGSASDEVVQSIKAPEFPSNANAAPKGQEKLTPEKKSIGAAQRRAAEMDAQRIAEEAALADKQHELEVKAAEQEAREKQLEQDRLRVDAEKQKAQEASEAAEKMRKQAAAVEAERTEQAAARQPRPSAYSGPSSGVIVWQGTVKGTTLVTINGNSSDVGQIVSGALPGVLVMIQPADAKHVGVASTPAPSNSYQRLTLRVQGNGVLQESIRWSIP